MFALRTGKLFCNSSRVIRNIPIRSLSAGKIIYTETDEAPALATYSLLPVVRSFGAKAGIEVVKSDISLSSRILGQFPKYLTAEQQVRDNLADLGELCKTPEANIIKLPNVSASLPQLVEAISELRGKGFNVPVYVSKPTTEEEKSVFARYAKVLGSAVNPVLREGNSDRRVAGPVKQYAKKNPHSMGAWSRSSRTHVAHMTKGDFYGSEQSVVFAQPAVVRIEHVSPDGKVSILKETLNLKQDEILDSSFLSVRELRTFLETEIEEAYQDHILLSLHLKATMMKVSDPVIFGHAVTVFFKDLFEKHAVLFREIGVNQNNGFNDVLEKLKGVPEATRAEVMKDIDEVYEHRPWLAMVNSHKGITNLHVPSDVIVDASMPVVVRDSGKMWDKNDQLEDVKCIIPDRCYASMYQEVISYCKTNGQFDVRTMGNVANVGLMAQKAEEYGSHDKTFVIPQEGTVRVVNAADDSVVMSHVVEAGDIWRACQTKDAPVKDWVRLAVSRARATGSPAIFWLDGERAHDRNLITKVQTYLKLHDLNGLDVTIQTPVHAMRTSCERASAGLDTISVTGNVLRDYLTDLFPILELGTSAKMLSIVPLLAGGGLFETGAGGSAPKHVQQFVKEGHLRWDSLGEYLALAVSLEHLGETTKNTRALALATSLNQAIERLLTNRKSPSRKVNEIDNRASNFYIALYWSEAMAKVDPEYAGLAAQLKAARGTIVAELKACQGHAVDLGGYYKLDEAKTTAAMRPSATFNSIIDGKW